MIHCFDLIYQTEDIWSAGHNLLAAHHGPVLAYFWKLLGNSQDDSNYVYAWGFPMLKSSADISMLGIIILKCMIVH